MTAPHHLVELLSGELTRVVGEIESRSKKKDEMYLETSKKKETTR